MMRTDALSLPRALAGAARKAALGRFASGAAERGAIVVVAVVACIMLCAVGALGVDATRYYEQRAEQTNASEMCMQAVESEQATVVKFSDDPGREIASVCARILRQNGYEGDIKVHYWEDRSYATLEDRYFAYAIECDGTYLSLFGAFVGKDSLEVKTTVFGSERMYNSERCWRPSWSDENIASAYDVDNGTYSWDAGETSDATPSFKPVSTVDGFPTWVADGFKDIYHVTDKG